jgi:hypothetical protein
MCCSRIFPHYCMTIHLKYNNFIKAVLMTLCQCHAYDARLRAFPRSGNRPGVHAGLGGAKLFIPPLAALSAAFTRLLALRIRIYCYNEKYAYKIKSR